jgi:MOSC domain-containing protein YiiM
MNTVNGHVEAVFFTPDSEPETGVSVTKDFIDCDFSGVIDDKHYGQTLMTRGARETEVFNLPRNNKEKIETANWRQWSAVSVEDLEIIAKNLKLKEIDPQKLASLMGANILVSGIDNFSKIPGGTLITFSSGTILKVEAENFPCVFPGKEISSVFPEVKAATFPKLAWGLRGIVGTVFRKGKIHKGDTFCLYNVKSL